MFFCDPDLYPVAREVTDQEIAQRVQQIQQDPAEYQAILKRLGLEGITTLSPEQGRMIDAEHKRLGAIELVPSGEGYSFRLRTRAADERGMAIEGVIDSGGVVTVSRQEPATVICPICLSGSTLIETPRGPLPVRALQPGMPVWTVDRAGVKRAAVILQTISRPAASQSWLVHLELEDGRELLVSPGHPTLDGRRIADLQVGETLDGARIARTGRVTLNDTATYDILPSGDRGAYWANGILLASTLAPAPPENR